MDAASAATAAAAATDAAASPTPPTAAERASLDAKLRARALACVAQREHSRVELRRKLAAYLDRAARAAVSSARLQGDAVHVGDDAGDTADTGDAGMPDAAARVEAVLDWLTERDLLSVERFVDIRVQARAGRYGQLRIRQEMARHGVALDAATEQRLRDTELARARAVWSRHFASPADAREHARQMRFLLARGFSGEVARQVLRGAGADEAAGEPTDD